MSITEKILNEIDWDNTFQGTKKKCLNTTDLVRRLNELVNNRRIEDELGTTKGKKHPDYKKQNINEPHIHLRSPFVQKGKKEKENYDYIDAEYFKNQITIPPKQIIKDTNEKIGRTGGRYNYVYNTGIPALRGIVYDIDENKFYIINTCPTAYTCVNICYAMKGGYIQYPDVSVNNTRTLNYLLNYPEQYAKKMEDELKQKCKDHGAYISKRIGGKENKNTVVVRFNDSGDFFSDGYYKLVVSVLRSLRAQGFNVRGYAHTKIASVANGQDDDVMIASFSTDATPSELSKVSDDNKRSTTVPRELFKKYDLYDYSDSQSLLDDIASIYDIPRDTLFYFDDYIEVSSNDPNDEYNVVVSNKDGDDTTFRKDVNQIFHLEH